MKSNRDAKDFSATVSPITLAIAVCLYICVTRLMTWVKGLSVVATPDPSSFISFSHSAKLAEASCKESTKTVRVRPSFRHPTLSPSAAPHCFWDIKGKTINGAAGCPTFPGRERKRKGRERWRIPMEATPSKWAAMLGGSWVLPIIAALWQAGVEDGEAAGPVQ